MKNKYVIDLLMEIRDMANHWYETDCHDKCHDIMSTCTEEIESIEKRRCCD